MHKEPKKADFSEGEASAEPMNIDEDGFVEGPVHTNDSDLKDSHTIST